MQRVIKRLEIVGRVDGWLFQAADYGVDRAFASDYAENIYSKLETLQRTTKLIGCDVREECGIQRSGRRFFHTRSASISIWVSHQLILNSSKGSNPKSAKFSNVMYGHKQSLGLLQLLT
jgi:hypothetical protein